MFCSYVCQKTKTYIYWNIPDTKVSIPDHLVNLSADNTYSFSLFFLQLNLLSL